MRRLIQFELRKIFSRRLTQFFLLALFLVSVLFMFSTYQNKYAFDGVSREGSGREAVEIDKSIAEKYRGPLTDEKVQQMLADFHTESDINAKYLYQNAMQFCPYVPGFQILTAIGMGRRFPMCSVMRKLMLDMLTDGLG